MNKKIKIGNILSGLITALLVITLFSITYQRIKGALPSIFGYRVMYVVTGSMEPEINVDDAILVKDVDPSTLKVGDIICYKSESEDTYGMLITHEVVKAPYTGLNDDTYIITQGIANATADEPIRLDQVVGIMTYKFKLLGYLYRFYKTIYGLITIIVLVVLAIVNEAIGIYKTYQEDRKEEEENDSENSEN